MLKSRIPTIIGIFTLMAGVAAGVLLVQERSIFKLGAAPDTKPQHVKISNVSTNSFTVSWVTEKNTFGYIKWGESQSLGQVSRGGGVSESTVHHITLVDLTPQKTYFFEINSEGDDYNDSGQPWSIKLPSTPGLETSMVISGAVIDPFGTPLGNGVVYISGAGLSLTSTKTTSSGGFVVNLSGSYNTGFSGPAAITDGTVIEISVQGGALGVSSAKINLSDANPIPTMMLGSTYDFVSLLPSRNNQLPEVQIQLPESTNLDSVQEGETIFSTN